MEPLVRGVLECRFEQIDAGADEAVEMVIADLLSVWSMFSLGNSDYKKKYGAVAAAPKAVFTFDSTKTESPAPAVAPINLPLVQCQALQQLL